MKIIFLLCFLIIPVVHANNHRQGLTLQLEHQFVDIKPYEVEQLQVASKTPARAVVLLKLNERSITRLRSITKNAIGQHAVWIWNGRVVAINTLHGPLDADLAIDNFTPQEAEQFLKEVKSK